MKDKIIVIILIIVFVGMIILLNNLLKIESNKMISQESKILNNQKEEKDMVIKVGNDNFEEEVLKSEKTVLIDFYADWCGPCQMLSPIVEKVAEENEDIKVVKLNIDEEQDLAIKYGVMSIPTLVVVKNGQEVNRVIGLVSKSEVEELIGK